MDGKKALSVRSRALIVVGVAAVLVAIAVLKTVPPRPAVEISDAQAPAASPTATRNDATADYEAALRSGKPVYVLFHSLTCQSCVEISGVADKVVPAYEDRIVFVNAITDDPSAQRLAGRFGFEYIPTSFFLRADGSVEASQTGVLSEAEMKARLDDLATP